MKGSEFIFDSADLLYYRFNEISLNRGGSYIVSLIGQPIKETIYDPPPQQQIQNTMMTNAFNML